MYNFEMPADPPKRRWFRWTLLVLVILFIVGSMITGIATDWLWYREVGRTNIYWTMFWGQWLLGLGVALGFFLIVFVNLLIALRETAESAWIRIGQQLRERELHILDRTVRRIAGWLCAIVALLFAWGIGNSAANYWTQFLLFAHSSPLGTTDPIFHHDIAFYLFRLPVWQLFGQWLSTAIIFAFVLTALIYLATGAIRIVGRMPVAARPVEAHLAILLALVFLTKALGYYLGRFTLLYSSNALYTGAGYADVHARIPALWIMTVIAVLAAIVILASIGRRNIAIPIGALVVMIVASLLVLGIWPAFVQRFRVAPNELALESPYLAHHIQLTRQAYGLEKVKSVEFDPASRVTGTALTNSPITVNNIRLWDYRPLLQVYKQRQELRTYYEINSVDVDRYQLGGQMRQVMVSAREMNVDRIPGQQAWVNRHLIYTHGYGLVMSPVNAFDPDKGEPLFLISDIPPRPTDSSLRITRPEIYFGETDSEYAIVHSRQQEFDYPEGDNNKYTTYQGTAGISLRNPLVRSLMASRFNNLNMLISNYVTPDSRIVIRRQILDRARAQAPFLDFDSDPYIVVGNDGRLYWIMDAYTHSTLYPYAAHYPVTFAGAQTVSVNYLRNPVKVVIDAYNGTTNYYLVDPQEPFIKNWSKIFPGLFKPLSAIPAGLADHLRMPEGMLNTVSTVYQRYHMTEPTTFYGQEDLWDIPQETTVTEAGDQQTLPMEAYYIVMSLPGQTTPEYLLIRPYTPSGRKNMIAWLSARNDPDHLGDLLVYNFPKQSLVYGPEQVEARINQAPDISQAFTLWGQAGSRVWKGNLLVIPIGNSILYVQPIYLQAEQSQIPELQRVIVADQERVVMNRTLEEALAGLTGGVPTAPTPTSSQPAATAPTGAPPAVAAPTPGQSALAHSALDHYNRAQQALQHGDWSTYGREMDAVKHDLQALNGQK